MPRTRRDPVLLILVALIEGPLSAKQCLRSVEQFAHVSLSLRTLDASINRLVDRGMVGVANSDSEASERTYEMTDIGRSSLENQIEELSRILRATRLKKLAAGVFPPGQGMRWSPL